MTERNPGEDYRQPAHESHDLHDDRDQHERTDRRPRENRRREPQEEEEEKKSGSPFEKGTAIVIFVLLLILMLVGFGGAIAYRHFSENAAISRIEKEGKVKNAQELQALEIQKAKLALEDQARAVKEKPKVDPPSATANVEGTNTQDGAAVPTKSAAVIALEEENARLKAANAQREQAAQLEQQTAPLRKEIDELKNQLKTAQAKPAPAETDVEADGSTTEAVTNKKRHGEAELFENKPQVRIEKFRENVTTPNGPVECRPVKAGKGGICLVSMWPKPPMEGAKKLLILTPKGNQEVWVMQ